MYQHILAVGIHGLSYYIASVYLLCTGSCAVDCFPHCCTPVHWLWLVGWWCLLILSGYPTRKIPDSKNNFLMAQFCTLKIQWAVLKLLVDENCMINLFCSSQNPRLMNENMNQRLELQNDPCTHDESKLEMCTNRLLVQCFMFT